MKGNKLVIGNGIGFELIASWSAGDKVGLGLDGWGRIVYLQWMCKRVVLCW